MLKNPTEIKTKNLCGFKTESAFFRLTDTQNNFERYSVKQLLKCINSLLNVLLHKKHKNNFIGFLGKK